MLQDTAVDLIDQDVANPDTWFGEKLNVKDWQEPYRVPGTAPQTLARQLLLAMGEINARLGDYQAAQAAVGVAGLPAAHLEHYKEAVFAFAMGLLIPLLPSAVTAEKAPEGLALKPEVYFARAADFIQRIAGTGGSGRLLAEMI